MRFQGIMIIEYMFIRIRNTITTVKTIVIITFSYSGPLHDNLKYVRQCKPSLMQMAFQ